MNELEMLSEINQNLDLMNKLKRLEIAKDLSKGIKFGNLDEYFSPEQKIRRIFNEIQTGYFWSDKESFDPVDNSGDAEIISQNFSNVSSNNSGL